MSGITQRFFCLGPRFAARRTACEVRHSPAPVKSIAPIESSHQRIGLRCGVAIAVSRVSDSHARLCARYAIVADADDVGPVCARPALAQRAAIAAETLMNEPAIRAALDARSAPTSRDVIDEQVRLCEIPAPPFDEAGARAGLQGGVRAARSDATCASTRPATCSANGRGGSRARIWSSAPTWTPCFPKAQGCTTTRTGSTIAGPGSRDDCRGLAVVLGVIRALRDAQVETTGTITFVGTVGEEGLGDLRGVKHLFNTELKGRIDRFVSVDGAGMGITRIGGRQPAISGDVQGPGRSQLRRFRHRESGPRARRAIAAIAALEVPRIQRRRSMSAGSAADVGQRDRGRGVDGSGPAIDGPRGAGRARRDDRPRRWTGAGGGERAVEETRGG